MISGFELLGLIFSIIATAIVTAFVTYYVTSKTQKRSWKREDIKEIYIPLRTELNINKEKCKNLDLLERKVYNKLNENYFIGRIPEDLRERLNKFYNKDLQKFKDIRTEALRKITDTINEFLELKKIEEEKSRSIEAKHELNSIYNLKKQHLLDSSWGIPISILHEEFEKNSFLNEKFNRIKNVLNLNFKSIEEFYNHFLNEYKLTKEYAQLHKNKEKILSEIEKLSKLINEIIGNK